MFGGMLLPCAIPISDRLEQAMGKGDRRTRKGKINIRSYGNKRPHAEPKTVVGKAVAAKGAAPTKAPAKKAAPAASRKKA
jgi:ribosomal small subunit protein bTHX